MYEVLLYKPHSLLLQARDSLLFAAALQVLVSIAIYMQRDYEDMALERSRNGAHAVDEVNVGAEDNEQAVAGQDVKLSPTAQLRRRKPVHRLIQQIPKMSSRFVKKIRPAVGKALKIRRHRSGSEGYSSGSEEIPSAMATEPNSPRGGENFLGALPSSSIESDGENILGQPPVENQVNQDLKDLIIFDYSKFLEPEFVTSPGDAASRASSELSNSHPASARTSVRGSTQGDIVINMSSEGDPDSVDTKVMEDAALKEEIKNALKFSYFSTGMAGAGILGLVSESISNEKEKTNGSNEKEQTNCTHLKICIILTLATIISGASMILITFLRSHTHVSIHIIKYLKYATLGLLTVATFDASILFLEVYALLAFVPTMVVGVVAFIRAPRHD